jgi:hypothetical protein
MLYKMILQLHTLLEKQKLDKDESYHNADHKIGLNEQVESEANSKPKEDSQDIGDEKYGADIDGEGSN